MTSVALIEDDAVYRELLERLLHGSGRYQVRHAFDNAEDALRVLPQQPTNVALFDVNLPGLSGPAAILQMRQMCPALQCMILTMSDDVEDLFSALQAGAVGYVLKSSTAEQIVAAVDELVAGGAPMSRLIARRVVAAFTRLAPAPGTEELTPREREILDKLTRGLSDKEIAAELGVSPSTIKNHLYRVYVKLQVRSRTEAVLKWLGR